MCVFACPLARCKCVYVFACVWCVCVNLKFGASNNNNVNADVQSEFQYLISIITQAIGDVIVN